MRTIEVSGLVNAESGIGVIQRNLYPLLQQHFNVVEASTRGESRIRGAFRGLFAGRKGFDGHLCLVSPLPFRYSRPLVTVVHDLRWQRDTSFFKRMYRKVDLWRMVKHSNTIVCAERRRLHFELVSVFPSAGQQSNRSMAWYRESRAVRRSGMMGVPVKHSLMLGTRARRKRNELVAQGYPVATVVVRCRAL